MPRHVYLTLASVLLLQTAQQAAPPSASILPEQTKLHVSIPDVVKLEKAWQKTQFAQMAEDPKVKPLIDDLTKESTIGKLGLSWQDLVKVASGELGIATILTGPGQAGTVLTLDTKGKKSALDALLAKVTAALEKRDFKRGQKNLDGATVTALILPAKDKKERERTVLYVVLDDLLVAADHEGVMEAVIKRYNRPEKNRLDQMKPYQEVLARSKAKVKTSGELFWFAEPLGLAEAERATAPPAGKPKRGPDWLKTLQDEGFTAVQGVGGHVALGQGDYDVLHHTAVFAPQPYKKSMRMLRTPAGSDFTPPEWVPGDAAMVSVLYVDVANAYTHMGSLFDAFYAEGDAGTFEDIIRGLKEDPNGPQIDFAKQVVARLGNRVTVVTDTERPIGLYSQRTLIAVETNDQKGLERAVRLLMENDDEVKAHKLKGDVVIYEFVAKERKKKKDGKPAVVKAKGPNSAVAVAHGHLFMSSHVKFLEKVLVAPDQGLLKQADYQRVTAELDKLGAGKLAPGKDFMRLFSRPDQDLEVVYEMLRSNQLENTPSLYAKALVAVFGENVTQIDGSKFPEYEHIRKYLGPTGHFGINDNDGWFIVGCTLKRK